MSDFPLSGSGCTYKDQNLWILQANICVYANISYYAKAFGIYSTSIFSSFCKKIFFLVQCRHNSWRYQTNKQKIVWNNEHCVMQCWYFDELQWIFCMLAKYNIKSNLKFDENLVDISTETNYVALSDTQWDYWAGEGGCGWGRGESEDGCR